MMQKPWIDWVYLAGAAAVLVAFVVRYQELTGSDRLLLLVALGLMVGMFTFRRYMRRNQPPRPGSGQGES